MQIFSNGRYKSVLHRVIANPTSTRISVASLHSLPFESVVQPSPKLIDDKNPRRYKDTSYADFMEFISSREYKGKNFLESRRIWLNPNIYWFFIKTGKYGLSTSQKQLILVEQFICEEWWYECNSFPTPTILIYLSDVENEHHNPTTIYLSIIELNFHHLPT